MILSSAVRAYVCAEPIDMRKSIDGLAALVARKRSTNRMLSAAEWDG
jgi:hypothetical protein